MSSYSCFTSTFPIIFSQIISHKLNCNCNILHVIFYTLYFTCYISHVIFHTLYFTLYISRIIFYKVYFTRYISQVIFHNLYFTYYISQGIFHMLYFTFYISQGIFPMLYFTRYISHVIFHMLYFTRNISNVIFHMLRIFRNSNGNAVAQLNTSLSYSVLNKPGANSPERQRVKRELDETTIGRLFAELEFVFDAVANDSNYFGSEYKFDTLTLNDSLAEIYSVLSNKILLRL